MTVKYILANFCVEKANAVVHDVLQCHTRSWIRGHIGDDRSYSGNSNCSRLQQPNMS